MHEQVLAPAKEPQWFHYWQIHPTQWVEEVAAHPVEQNYDFASPLGVTVQGIMLEICA